MKLNYYFAFEYRQMRQTLLSVVIPTYNRPDRLAVCLESLSVQSADPKNWEVVVVNDGGSAIDEVIEPFQGRIRVVHLSQENRGPASARNLGAENSSGDILAFLDDDCLPDPDWVGKMTASVRQGELVGGKVRNHIKGNIYSETSQTLIDYLYMRLQGTTDMFFTSNNMGIHSADFRRIGGFDTGFLTSAGEDREFSVRAVQNGISLRFDPDLRIAHTHDLSFSSFLRLHFKYGRAADTYRRAVSKMDISNPRKGGRGFYLNLIIHPFRTGIERPLAQSFLLGVSQGCTICGFLYERLLEGR